MEIKVLLEGVENRNDALIADDIEADFVQGYYYGKPQPMPTSFPVQRALL
jgi:EAL domain-containing protein (putative c-di-GMP-specific phosphodiesterase class I)